ncbi:MAG: DUF4250 domain-containing protein [Lachnoclostridium sp.]|jgi:hypothetical protein
MIPKDPFILLSFVNTQLRDHYDNLSQLCENLGVSEKEITEKLGTIHYCYDPVQNQFK